jgi:hypothetical protein
MTFVATSEGRYWQGQIGSTLLWALKPLCVDKDDSVDEHFAVAISFLANSSLPPFRDSNKVVT